MSTDSPTTMHQVLSCHSGEAALIQTPLDALIMALEHFGNFFIMLEKKHHVNESLLKDWRALPDARVALM